jgi:hypothetical protein
MFGEILRTAEQEFFGMREVRGYNHRIGLSLASSRKPMCTGINTNTLSEPAAETPITASAVRMRASRRRRREGLRCITLDLRDSEIDRLIELGHLRQADREDKNQMLLGLYRFLDKSDLGGAHR